LQDKGIGKFGLRMVDSFKWLLCSATGAAFCYHVSNVIFHGTKKMMTWIATKAIITAMTH